MNASKTLYNLFKNKGFLVLLAVFFLGNHVWAAAAGTVRKTDLDGDGDKEANVYYEGSKIAKIVMDKNHDGKADATIYYRNGFRDYGELDGNYDGFVDTVILYYFTGVPASIAVDRNGDAKPERWTYFKNGIIYKRDWDRNYDGIPDYRIHFSTKADLRADTKGDIQAIVKEYDDNFDGIFEKKISTKKKSRAKRVSALAGSLSEEVI